MYFSELDIVNKCLIAIGSDKVTTLDNPDTDTDAIISILEEERVKLLAKGRWFNYEENFPISLNSSNKVAIPKGILSINVNSSDRFTPRGGFLYNLTKHTYDLSEIASNGEIKADVILLLDFNDIPVYGQTIIGANTVLSFANSGYGVDPSVTQIAAEHLRDAVADLQREELRQEKYNCYNSPASAGFLSGLFNYSSNPTGTRGE